MKRLGLLSAIAIALTLSGCSRSSETALSAADPATGADSALAGNGLPGNGSPQPATMFGDSLPPVPLQSSALQNSNTSSNKSSSKSSNTSSKQTTASYSTVAPRQVVAGRTNPFSSVSSPQVEVKYVTTAPAAPSTQAAPGPNTLSKTIPSVILPPTFVQATLPSMPQVASPSGSPAVAMMPTSLPPVRQLPASVTPLVAPPTSSSPTLSPAAAPPAPVLSPTAVAEAIEIKGVVQVGNQYNVIIRDPDASISRTVKVGDVIGGGRVKVSRIDSPDSQEPQVILEQNGVEVRRSIGV